MERNKWETAIRCLEVALHPNTGNDEVIAAVNGFRRTADGRRLRDICTALAGAGGGPVAVATPREEHGGLNRENRELRRKLADTESARAGAAERLHEKTEETGKLRAELRASRDAAAAAERQLGELHRAHRQLIDNLKRENAELRRTLGAARPASGNSGSGSGVGVLQSFGMTLASALGRGDVRPPVSAERTRPGNAPTAPRRGSGAAWIA